METMHNIPCVIGNAKSSEPSLGDGKWHTQDSNGHVIISTVCHQHQSESKDSKPTPLCLIRVVNCDSSCNKQIQSKLGPLN